MASDASTTFKVMNQDFVKLDRFDGTNFMRWKDNMEFLLTALKIVYMLDPFLKPIEDPPADATPEVKAKIVEEKKKREEDEFVCPVIS